MGIGGDPVNGTDFKTVLQAFEGDDDTDVVVMIGEIGGQQEVEAASWASQYMSKPLVAFIAGSRAARPPHGARGCGAIAGESDTATAKLDAIEALGHRVVRNPADIGDTVLRAVKETGNERVPARRSVSHQHRRRAGALQPRPRTKPSIARNAERTTVTEPTKNRFSPSPHPR